jgi:hypothetical protein
MTALRTVSVLCASRSSIYHSLPGVDVFDDRRDARTFSGDTPIVAHPPCRSWSAFCRHQAKPQLGERELGLWCVRQLCECGGVLEQPAFSGLFEAAGLPMPGVRPVDEHLWSLQVWQAWWGYPTRKATWLCFCGVSRDSVDVPYRIHPRGGDRRTMQLMSKHQRSRTTKLFADWLVACARSAAVAHIMELR